MPICFDIKLFYLINKGCVNPFFDCLMPWVTRLGSGEFIFCIAIILLLFKKSEKRTGGILLLASLTVSYYATGILKGLAKRPRPFMVFHDVHLLAQAGGYSFPSGHTILAFMTAAVLSQFFGRPWRGVFFLLASLVGFSRVYLGVHYVSDVIAGAAVGTLIGYAAVTLAKNSPSPRHHK